jgi:isopropylmalate/homocitrate/citramalate synthase
VRWSLYLHNTRYMALANALVGLEAGITHFDASLGGIGACPFVPEATGNVSTEDFVHMLHEMGIETGIDLDVLLAEEGSCERLSVMNWHHRSPEPGRRGAYTPSERSGLPMRAMSTRASKDCM